MASPSESSGGRQGSAPDAVHRDDPRLPRGKHEKPTPSLAARIVGRGALRYARPASETVADLIASKPP